MTTDGKAGEGGVRLAALTKQYKSMTAVDRLDLEVRDGELFTILGSSGSGKSTTLLMIAGFIRPTSGDVLIGGQNVNDLPPQKRNVGMIFQHYANFPHLTLFENIAFPLRARGIRQAQVESRVAEMLTLVQLEGLGDRLPHQLSGGQQQRAAIARAVAFRPRVLLMDEPLGALDKKLREYMQREIKALQQQLGLTVIYITHDQEEALALSDRIAIMRDGRLEQVGTPRELYDTPMNLCVAEFLGNSNILRGTAVAPGPGGLWTVAVDGAEVSGLPVGTVGEGAPVSVLIRPEHVRLTATPAAGDNAAAATVLDVKYLGDVSLVRVRLAGGAELTCKDLTERIAVSGGGLQATWPVQSTRIFPGHG